MSYYIVLGRDSIHDEWEYYGGDSGSEPEDAVRKILGDSQPITGDFQLRVVPVMEGPDGGPFWYDKHDLDF